MNILVLPAQAYHVRSKYLARGLNNLGHKTTYMKALKPLPYNLDIILSLPHYFLKTLVNSYTLAIGAKPYPNVVLPLLLKKLFGTIIIMDVDDLDYGYKKGILSSLLKNFQKLFLKYFDLIIYHNENIKNLLTESFRINPDKTYRLDQGVDLEIFQCGDDLVKQNRLDNHPPKEKVIAYTAHLNSAADLTPILKAFKLVIQKMPKVKLMVIGGGQRQGEFENLVAKLDLQDNVFFTDTLPPQDVAKHLCTADLALVYYEDREVNYYRASVKIREYLALGLPVVCNDICDLAIFRDYTYQTNFDLSLYSDKIIEVLRTKGDGREKQSRQFIVNNFNWKTITATFLEFLYQKFR